MRSCEPTLKISPETVCSSISATSAPTVGGRGDEDALPETGAVVEDDLGPFQVRDEGVNRLLDDQPNPTRSEVVDDVALVHELVHDRGLEHRVDDEVEVVARHQVLDVAHRPGREVVERIDLPAVVQQPLAEVRPDEARSRP